MTVGFNPSVSNNKQKQKQNFCAISQKHFQKAQNAVKNRVTYDIAVRDVQDAYGLKEISKQDAQDTLDAIKQIYPEKFHKIVDTAKKWVDSFSK